MTKVIKSSLNKHTNKIILTLAFILFVYIIYNYNLKKKEPFQNVNNPPSGSQLNSQRDLEKLKKQLKLIEIKTLIDIDDPKEIELIIEEDTSLDNRKISDTAFELSIPRSTVFDSLKDALSIRSVVDEYKASTDTKAKENSRRITSLKNSLISSIKKYSWNLDCTRSDNNENEISICNKIKTQEKEIERLEDEIYDLEDKLEDIKYDIRDTNINSKEIAQDYKREERNNSGEQSKGTRLNNDINTVINQINAHIAAAKNYSRNSTNLSNTLSGKLGSFTRCVADGSWYEKLTRPITCAIKHF